MSGGHHVVVIDASLEALIPGYINNRHEDLRTLNDALARGEFDKIRIIGHSMKGSGGGYGFDSITDYGATLEVAATRADVPTIQETLTQLQEFLRNLVVRYE